MLVCHGHRARGTPRVTSTGLGTIRTPVGSARQGHLTGENHGRESRNVERRLQREVNPVPCKRMEVHMSKPTIVLVHAAFGDASNWRSVFEHLDGEEYTILAAAIPLRGVASDAAYLGAVIDQLEGPVVLVGHSYSGSVITVAGASEKVAGLVYVAGFAPDEGESIADLQARFPSLAMGDFLQPTPLPDGGVELTVDPQRFHQIFCADVSDGDAEFMAHAQRPLLASAFEEPATAAAWRVKPSWGIFGTGDQPIAPQLHRFSYERAGSKVTEIEGASHFVMLSKPSVVAGVIRDAVRACSANPVA
jgi:pimeloyl-ACP methyl ester carboxylesterase